MGRFAYDYYVIDLPGDWHEDLPEEEWLEKMSEQAIAEARERSTLYCVPAEWRTELVEGKQGDFHIAIKVRRKRSHRDK